MTEHNPARLRCYHCEQYLYIGQDEFRIVKFRDEDPHYGAIFCQHCYSHLKEMAEEQGYAMADMRLVQKEEGE